MGNTQTTKKQVQQLLFELSLFLACFEMPFGIASGSQIHGGTHQVDRRFFKSFTSHATNIAQLTMRRFFRALSTQPVGESTSSISSAAAPLPSSSS
jgi:hypothetical protein